MSTKKDLLVLGLVAAGGLGIVKLTGAGEKEGVGVTGGNGFKPFPGIVGTTETVTDNGDNAGTAPIVIPPQAPVTFPPIPAFRLPEFPFVTPEPEESPDTPVYKTKKWRTEQIEKGVGAYLSSSDLAKFKRGERVNVKVTPKDKSKGKPNVPKKPKKSTPDPNYVF